MAQSYWKWEEQEVEYFDVIFTYFDGEVELIESFQYSENKQRLSGRIYACKNTG